MLVTRRCVSTGVSPGLAAASFTVFSLGKTPWYAGPEEAGAAASGGCNRMGRVCCGPSDEALWVHAAGQGFLSLFVFFFKILFIHRHAEREREAETQAEREAGSMRGPRRGTRSWDPGVTPWAKGRCSTAEPPGALICLALGMGL